MSDAKNREVAIVMFRYSVISKGIERKLSEMGYTVTTVFDRPFEEIKHCAAKADLTIIYLQPEITADLGKKQLLHMMSEEAVEKKHRMILIGDDKYHQELIGEVTLLKDYPWIDHPLDMKVLEQTVWKEMQEVERIEKKPRILIIDDDPSYARMVREWIKAFYRVDVVTAGMQAITFLVKVPEEEKVDLILLDYEMPIVDGPQVLQMLRQEPATEHIPVIFLTGVGTREAVKKVMELKPAGYILKSTTRDDLLTFLHKKLT